MIYKDGVPHIKCRCEFGYMKQMKTEWKCDKCGRTKPRFIKKVQPSPLFYQIVIKTPETKKFLEDIRTKEQEEERPREKRDSIYMKEGTVFVRRDGKIVACYNAGDYLRKIAKEASKK